MADPVLPRRKGLRLAGYDYSSNGAYFVTLRLAGGAAPLREAGADRPLAASGRVISDTIRMLGGIYETVYLDKYCIMPDHIHMILFISTVSNEGAQAAPSLSRVIKQFKGAITKQLGHSIWQKSFNDRVIRNEREYLEIWQYIDNNPLAENAGR